MTTITLHLHGLPTQTLDVELIRVENGYAVVRGYLGDEELYSLNSGKRLGTNWDFWRLSEEDMERLREDE